MMFDAAAFIQSLPTGPGVYRMLDARGRVLYVGKAKNLRRRVASYFGPPERLSARIAFMVGRTASMQATPVASEAEALVLERSLIRTLAPRYNIAFRDDSSYPYLVFTDEPFARLVVRRRPFGEVGTVFGPYPAADRAWRAAYLLRKVFRIRDCDETTFANRSRPCLQHQLHRCDAPCVGKASAREYAESIAQAQQVLRGGAVEVRRSLEAQMLQAAAQLAFERAAVLRDRIADLGHVSASQSVEGMRGEDTDVLAVAELHGARLVAVGMMRAGRWMGERFVEAREARAADATDGASASHAELLEAFLLAEYASGAVGGGIRLVIAPGVALDEEVLDAVARRGVRVARRLTVDMRRWLEMTRQAALLQLRSRELRASTQRERAADLSRALGLGHLARIECFDVSHTQGERAVAACVVWEDGMKRSAYRRFDVAPASRGDDYAAIEEAVHRRFDGMRVDEAVLPQLFMIDGGPGQVERASIALARAGVLVPVLGIAKGPGRVVGQETLHRGWAGDALRLAPDHPGLLLAQEIRDEAHRVALAGHRARRGAARLAHPLDDVPGLGPVKKKALLQACGGLAGVQAAAQADLARIQGIGPRLAASVWQRMHGAGA